MMSGGKKGYFFKTAGKSDESERKEIWTKHSED